MEVSDITESSWIRQSWVRKGRIGKGFPQGRWVRREGIEFLLGLLGKAVDDAGDATLHEDVAEVEEVA